MPESFITGPFGTWLPAVGFPDDPDERAALGTRLEDLPIASVWLGGSLGTDLSIPAALLRGSSELTAGTSITNIWRDPAADVAAAAAHLFAEFGDRFVLGVGAGHASQTDWNQHQYHRPLAALASYLDELDAAEPAVRRDQRALAGLGPKAIELAGRRSLGVLPLLTTPAHTREAREILGDGPLLAPGQKFVLETDGATAREIARADLKYYLTLPNYTAAWRRMGFEDKDLEDGGSDRLIDAIYAHGTPDQIRARFDEHLNAGADQVAIQPVFGPTKESAGTGAARAIEVLERLAPVLE